MVAVKERLAEARASRLTVRFFRYSIGSIVAIVASEVAFVLCYASGLLGTTGSSIVAFVAGAVPNYVLNRSWAWERKGRPRIGREVILYAVVSLVSLISAAAATGWVSRIAPHFTASHATRTALVATAYLATYGVLFIIKFVIFQRVVFVEPRSDHATTW
ncbi:MAG TPA: GtrA family protein [Acidimicrobiales bacterium]|nr:GtrA family protein [Acidimicrobiales bacterium]